MDIESAAVFLCSAAASFINGAILVVDGGQWVAGEAVRLTKIGIDEASVEKRRQIATTLKLTASSRILSLQ